MPTVVECSLSQSNIRCYWSKSWPFSSDNFSSLMSSHRFELILRFLHLNDSQNQPQRGHPGYDKIRPLLSLILPSFRSSYTPSQFISIDESMIAFKGRLPFLQYLPKKSHKWAWVLADAMNGYTWSWKWKEGGSVETGLAHKVVLELVNDDRLLQKGYVVVTDNFYSSPALFRDLVQRGIGACGTARKDRRSIPPAIRTTNLQRGGVVSSRDDGILSLKWKGKRDVVMLSTYHDSTMVTKSRRAEGGVEDIEKPLDYNVNMGGVDKSKFFRHVYMYICARTCTYKTSHFQATCTMDSGFSQRTHHEPAPELPLRLTERAFPEPIPGGKRADCKVCSVRVAGQRHQTVYRCHTALCLYPCFERFTRSKTTSASTEATCIGRYPSLSSSYTLSMHVHQATRPTSCAV